MTNYISFANILKERDNFRKAGANSGSEFNLFDTPGHKYFKLFFYFNNGDVGGNYNPMSNNGLLAPTWLIDGVNDTNYYMYNSAWSYLKMNNEDERADLLVDFVNLLSNISSESPWYFSEVTGLDSAMDRKSVGIEYFIVDPTRPKISIKCLPDAYDDRIGSLLDLYRSIVWSWATKREIVPANLRKFDMGILIFDTPNSPFHKLDKLIVDEFAQIGDYDPKKYTTSYKYIELHNCEIDYNSSKILYASLNNKEGNSVEYTIDIHFDDCYETRYNEFSLKKFGDLIEYDMLNGLQISKYEYKSQGIDKQQRDKLQDRINGYDKGFMGNAINQLVSTGVDKVTSLVERAILGNLYTFSLTKIGSQMKGLIQGNVMGTAKHIQEYLKDNKQSGVSNKLSGDAKLPNTTKQSGVSNELSGDAKLPNTTKPDIQTPFKTGKILVDSTLDAQLEYKDSIGTMSVKKRIIPKVKYIGNLYKGNTIANNI